MCGKLNASSLQYKHFEPPTLEGLSAGSATIQTPAPIPLLPQPQVAPHSTVPNTEEIVGSTQLYGQPVLGTIPCASGFSSARQGYIPITAVGQAIVRQTIVPGQTIVPPPFEDCSRPTSSETHNTSVGPATEPSHITEGAGFVPAAQNLQRGVPPIMEDGSPFSETHNIRVGPTTKPSHITEGAGFVPAAQNLQRGVPPTLEDGSSSSGTETTVLTVSDHTAALERLERLDLEQNSEHSCAFDSNGPKVKQNTGVQYGVFMLPIHLIMWSFACLSLLNTKVSRMVFRVVKDGYRFRFNHLGAPKPCQHPNYFNANTGRRVLDWVDQQFKIMEDHDCVMFFEPGHIPPDLLILPMFCVPKGEHGEGLRLIIDASPLNKHLATEKFSLPSLERLRWHLDAAHCLLCYDFSSAYHHIAIHPDHWKYVGFRLPSGRIGVYKRCCLSACHRLHRTSSK